MSPDEFTQLVDEHGGAMYRMAFRMVGDRHEAEDLVQDAFRSAWLSREGFDPARSPRAWLAAILRRRAIDRWRRKMPRLHSSEEALQAETLPEDPLANDYSDEMQRALGQLPDVLRETLLLVAVGELTHQEVAELLDIPLGTVLSRVSRARTQLREHLLAAVRR